jgi:hypothetical protein
MRERMYLRNGGKASNILRNSSLGGVMLFQILANGAAVAAVLGIANLTSIDGRLLRLRRFEHPTHDDSVDR